ncbi:protein-L-isoaspartate(D-aspartate) O-methyltransferase [Sulfurivermis fontis]|uniref:protein-L-isoaspartate(D-aspartate) O-methyltransferase n=1 Tax=Sulfurivermis fontis TaxID=1972068 RepID=UPI000FD6E2CF|nr:protein-L-isoaspartate(D-aspartate) O-methyltransferase [Sulfurivermis fontis]
MMRESAGIGMTSQRTRERMVTRLMEQGIRDLRVLEVMRTLPRHLFVDEALATRAYEDTALPIGSGQTISQPYAVARMTEALLNGGRPRKVLEVGTGCGYQSAVLAALVDEVFSVERIGDLVRRTRERLQRLQIRNVRLRHGDGYAGWAEHGPYDGILVAAAPTQVPAALLEQLADGGRLIVPVGNRGSQQLLLVSRSNGELKQEVLEMVSFVPMVPGASQ